ncbi:MAG TPA: TetR/AcrR family transcriptional regulator [Solirubrobacterales bacterium]|nr:TetR/AcrR family transcriptional regulator [Solirubrobacterales bacterium]
MVMTPWGDSAALRERRLSPGPGTPAADVERNQRERLFAAMIAAVAERGYGAVRVSDLVALSGVSTRTFYALFEDKEDLFLATIDAILAETGQVILGAAEGQDAMITAAVERAGEILLEQPVTARVCLVDALGAGPRVGMRLAEASARFESLLAQVASHRWPDAPPELFPAWVGGLFDLARIRLLEGSEAEIPSLFADFIAIFRSYVPPAQPLRFSARQPTPVSGSVAGYDHADRAIQAFAAVVAERGYAEATVEETLRRASMSARTFYANFADKEDVLLVAIESAGSRAVAASTLAFRRVPEWAPAVRAGLGAFFNFLAFRPALASVLLVGYAGGGAEAIRRRADVMRPLERLVDGGLRRDPTMPATVREAMVACVLALAGRVMSERGTAALPALAPICTHLILTPFIGTAAAAEIANGDGRSRSNPEMLEALERMVASTLSRQIMALLGAHEDLSVPSIAAALERPEAEIERELVILAAAGHVNATGEQGTQRFYRSLMRLTTTDEWSRLEEGERARISARILATMRAEVDLAVASGTFDARPDRHLVRVRGSVDEEGWTELGRIYEEASYAAIRALKAAESRLTDSDEEAVEVCGDLLLFEMPKDRDGI